MSAERRPPCDASPDAGEAHAGRVQAMFGRISGWYDVLNRALSLGQDVYWRRELCAHASAGANGAGLLVDLAAGTMDVALGLAKRYPHAQVAAADFAEPMLRHGAKKLATQPDRLRRRVWPLLADGRRLPLRDSVADCATMAFGIRNITPRHAAYAEALRLLKPGGRFVILEFGSAERPIMKGLYNLYLNRLLPTAGRLVSGDRDAYRYLADTIRAFPPPRALAQELLDAGFDSVFHRPLTFGVVNIHVAVKAG